MDLVFRFAGLFPLDLLYHVNHTTWQGWGPRRCKIASIHFEDGHSTVIVEVKSEGWDWPTWNRETGFVFDFNNVDFGEQIGPGKRTILIEQQLHEEIFSRN